MNAVTRMTPPVSSYAPGASNISEATVEAVDKIGNATSEAIEHTAETIEAEAKELADKLRKLASAMREHTRMAAEEVSGFCLKMTSARAIIRGLEVEIAGKLDDQDKDPAPAFLTKPI